MPPLSLPKPLSFLFILAVDNYVFQDTRLSTLSWKQVKLSFFLFNLRTNNCDFWP